MTVRQHCRSKLPKLLAEINIDSDIVDVGGLRSCLSYAVTLFAINSACRCKFWLHQVFR